MEVPAPLAPLALLLLLFLLFLGVGTCCAASHMLPLVLPGARPALLAALWEWVRRWLALLLVLPQLRPAWSRIRLWRRRAPPHTTNKKRGAS